LSNIEARNRKDEFSCDSLSWISCEITRNEKIHSVSSIKLHSIIINDIKQIRTLAQLSIPRSITQDLTSSVSNSFNENKIHQSSDLYYKILFFLLIKRIDHFILQTLFLNLFNQ